MPSQNEVALLRDSITEEVNRDAEVLGNQLFGQSADLREPDVSKVSEEMLRQVYRQKYLAQDRDWLTNEAQRDPQQFLRVAKDIGVVLPQQITPPQPPPVQPPIAPPVLPPQLAPQIPVPPPLVDPAVAAAALQQANLGGPGPQPMIGPVVPPMPVPPVAAPQPTVVLPPGA